MGVVGDLGAAIRHDLGTMLTIWRSFIFQDQRSHHPVTGPWRPSTTPEQIGFWTWTAIGIPVIAVLYPSLILGFTTRAIARRLDWLAGALGLVAVLLLAAIVWGLLTLIAWFRFPTTSFQAVLAASIIATASAGLSWGFVRLDGRPVTVIFAYPFGVAAVVLPPVTAALVSPTLGTLILAESYSLAVWLLDNVLTIRNLNEILRREFDLEHLAYLAMWFALAIPIGWVLGTLVTLANLVRPKPESDDKSPETDG